MNVGKRIAELRAANDMSQQTLADLLFVSRDLVSKWENGLRRPDYQTIERIAQLFDVSVDTIVDKEELFFDELSECFPEGASITEDQLVCVFNSFLHGLGKSKSDVFIKRYYFQKSITEISSEYGIGENHVRSIFSKTRKKLKKYIEEDRSWKK